MGTPRSSGLRSSRSRRVTSSRDGWIKPRSIRARAKDVGIPPPGRRLGDGLGLADQPSHGFGGLRIGHPRKPLLRRSVPAGPDIAKEQRSGRGIVKDNWSIGTHEFIGEKGYAGQKFRVVVEEEVPERAPGEVR